MRPVWFVFVAALGPAVIAGETGPQLKLLETLKGGRPGAYSTIAFSPDGKILAAGDYVINDNGESDSSVKLWDVEKRKAVATLQGDRGAGDNHAFSVAFSPDGKTLAVAGSELTLWDIGTRKKKASFKRQTAAAFSPDGKSLASLSLTEGTAVTLWEVETGKERASFKGDLGFAISIAFSSDGKLIATGSGKSGANGQSVGGEVTLWNVNTGKPQSSLKSSAHVFSVAFSPDSKTLAYADIYGNVVLWDVPGGKQKLALQKFNPMGREEDINGVLSVAFSPDGNTLAAGTVRGIKLWDVQSGKNVGPSAGPSATTIWAVAFARDGKTLASAGSKRVIRQTDSIDGDETLRLWEWVPAIKVEK